MGFITATQYNAGTAAALTGVNANNVAWGGGLLQSVITNAAFNLNLENPRYGLRTENKPGNTATINLANQATVRFLRLNITANTGWPAGQCSDFQVYVS